ncbi:hypothetical protein Kisp02_44160 [Kineosporia sp. NBRC 101731]|nr:hypothetical protein Kisp02_44160 [Kineosporia sp. NBRC 101731]
MPARPPVTIRWAEVWGLRVGGQGVMDDVTGESVGADSRDVQRGRGVGPGQPAGGPGGAGGWGARSRRSARARHAAGPGGDSWVPPGVPEVPSTRPPTGDVGNAGRWGRRVWSAVPLGDASGPARET